MSAGKPKHDYHLVDPSPWPIYVSFATLVLAFGAVYYFHSKALWLLLIGFALVVYGAFMWWRDVIEEAEHQGHHTPVVQIGHRYGMTLFIASEVMFFVAFFWAFFDVSLPGQADYRGAIGGVWPPEGVETMHAMGIPLLNTIILLSSGATVTWAHHGLRQNNRKQLIIGLILTLALGWTFTALQGYEYYEAKFAITEGIYPSTFFMATGFHGFHVIIGSLFLLVCLIRSIKGHFTPDHHVGFEAAAWYWHFVDVVWIFLFTVVYWWGTQ